MLMNIDKEYINLNNLVIIYNVLAYNLNIINFEGWFNCLPKSIYFWLGYKKP